MCVCVRVSVHVSMCVSVHVSMRMSVTLMCKMIAAALGDWRPILAALGSSRGHTLPVHCEALWCSCMSSSFWLSIMQ